MDFLKAILGDELYSQVEQAINTYNSKPENADKQVKLANLAGGEYVSKAKYDGLNTDNQKEVQRLTSELAQVKIDSAVKVGLLSENVVDADYLAFKLKEKGEKLELDEQGNIKGWADKIAALKTQLPTMFTSKGKGGYEGFKLLDKENQPQPQGMTKAELLKKSYAEQAKFFEENPEQYREIMKG